MRATEKQKSRMREYYRNNKRRILRQGKKVRATEKQKSRTREYYRNNKRRILRQGKKYRNSLSEKEKTRRRKHNLEYGRKYRRMNREKVRAAARKNHIKTKDLCFLAYGGYVCKCCKETIKEFLTIDHIHGRGRLRKKLRGNVPLYQWLFKYNFPRGYQVLCMNCNWGKHLRGGICPHKKGGK